jgi:hypothetical protein
VGPAYWDQGGGNGGRAAGGCGDVGSMLALLIGHHPASCCSRQPIGRGGGGGGEAQQQLFMLMTMVDVVDKVVRMKNRRRPHSFHHGRGDLSLFFYHSSEIAFVLSPRQICSGDTPTHTAGMSLLRFDVRTALTTATTPVAIANTLHFLSLFCWMTIQE